MFRRKKKETVTTVYDVYKNLVRGTEVKILKTGTMEELTIEESRDRKCGLIVPCGELKVNIFV